MFKLPGDHLFAELNRMGIRVALDIQAIAHDLDYGPGIPVNQVRHVQRERVSGVT